MTGQLVRGAENDVSAFTSKPSNRVVFERSIMIRYRQNSEAVGSLREAEREMLKHSRTKEKSGDINDFTIS